MGGWVGLVSWVKERRTVGGWAGELVSRKLTGGWMNEKKKKKEQ